MPSTEEEDLPGNKDVEERSHYKQPALDVQPREEVQEECQSRPNKRSVWRQCKVSSPVKRKLYLELQQNKRDLVNANKRLKRYSIDSAFEKEFEQRNCDSVQNI